VKSTGARDAVAALDDDEKGVVTTDTLGGPPDRPRCDSTSRDTQTGSPFCTNLLASAKWSERSLTTKGGTQPMRTPDPDHFVGADKMVELGSPKGVRCR
jgi:hypothetical protein